MGLRTRERVEEQAADDVALMRSRADQLTAKLREIDEAMSALEADRDAAETRLRDVQRDGSEGTALLAWRAEEARDTAQDRLGVLAAERQPLSAELGRLNRYLQPIDAVRAQAETDRERLAVHEQLAAVLADLDRVVEAIGAVNRRASREVPPSLRQLTATWGPQGWTRHKVGYTIGVTLGELRQRVGSL